MSQNEFCDIFHEKHSNEITDNFKAFLDNELYVDLIFICKNNRRVGAHQLVLSCISKFFYSIFIENENVMKEKVIYINVPDIRPRIMKLILQFIYSGTAMLNKEELKEFNDNIELLGMPLEIQVTLEENSKNSLELEKTVADVLQPLKENSDCNDKLNIKKKIKIKNGSKLYSLSNNDKNSAKPSESDPKTTSQNIITDLTSSDVPDAPSSSSVPDNVSIPNAENETNSNEFMPVISNVIALNSDSTSTINIKEDESIQIIDKPSCSLRQQNNRKIRKRIRSINSCNTTKHSKLSEQTCINLESDDDDEDVITIS